VELRIWLLPKGGYGLMNGKNERVQDDSKLPRIYSGRLFNKSFIFN